VAGISRIGDSASDRTHSLDDLDALLPNAPATGAATSLGGEYHSALWRLEFHSGHDEGHHHDQTYG
jgi:hypothetical protein